VSHTILLKNVRVSQQAARAAAHRLGWAVSATDKETVKFFDGSIHVGLSVKLPGWKFSLVVKEDGSLAYDNFHGNWGNAIEVSRLTGLALLSMEGEELSSVIITEAAGELCFETI